MAKKNIKGNKNRRKIHPFFPSFFWKYLSNLDKKLKKTPPNLVFGLIFFAIACLLVGLENMKSYRQVLGLQTAIQYQTKEIEKWEKIVKEKPDFRDGWLQLAAAYADIGDKEKAKEALTQAKNLDPNNQIIPSLEKLLLNQ